MRYPLISLVSLAGLAAPGAHAAESYDSCAGFITSLPAVITTQGTWCLNRDLSTAIINGHAITIETNNVTIDCNHFKLGGLSAGPATEAIGIHAWSRLNTTVRNCNIRGFNTGIQLVDANGSLVEDSRFDGNTQIGVAMLGDGLTVRRNHVLDTGPSAVSGQAIGIYISGNADVTDNSIDGVFASSASGPASDAVGILIEYTETGNASGNSVRNLALYGTGASIAIDLVSPGLVVATNNVVYNNTNFNGTTVGIRCSTNAGMVRGNIIRGFNSPLVACDDGGDNYTAPDLP